MYATIFCITGPLCVKFIGILYKDCYCVAKNEFKQNRQIELLVLEAVSYQRSLWTVAMLSEITAEQNK